MTVVNTDTTAGTTDRSAIAELRGMLDYYGLGSLGEFAWQLHLKGYPDQQIFLEIRKTPEYKARFPAMEFLSQKGRALNEQQYIDYERGVSAVFKAAGLPPGFYDSPDDFTNFLKNDIALPELQDRVEMARVAIYNALPEDIAALENFYGAMGNDGNLIGDLTAFFLDSDRAMPLIQKQFESARTAGVAARVGYGTLTQAEAERLANLGITIDQANEGFSTLASMEQLFTNLPGENMDNAPTRGEGQAAIFEQNADAQRKVGRQQRRRKAQFNSGGGYQDSQGGVSGIG